MKVHAALINDPLPLTLGARVTLRPEEARAVPMPLDIDLTVKWVGDVLDDEVQTSDLNHPACWEQLPQNAAKLETALFGASAIASPEVRAEQARHNAVFRETALMPLGLTPPRYFFTEQARRGFDRAAAPTPDEIKDFYRRMAYGGVGEGERMAFETRLRELAQASSTVCGVPVSTCDDYTVNGVRGFTRAEFERWSRGGAVAKRIG